MDICTGKPASVESADLPAAVRMRQDTGEAVPVEAVEGRASGSAARPDAYESQSAPQKP
jgi:hypothetical protein